MASVVAALVNPVRPDVVVEVGSVQGAARAVGVDLDGSNGVFTFQNVGKNEISIQFKSGRGLVAKLLQQAPLVMRANIDDRIALREEIPNTHGRSHS